MSRKFFPSFGRTSAQADAITFPYRPRHQLMNDTRHAASMAKMSLADLQQQLATVEAAIRERRVEELKVLADGYARKLSQNGFSVREGIEALRPYLRLKSFSA